MAHRLVVVGSGIVGLAHAKIAYERGWAVTVIERDPEPRGASVRNFGTLWPIGQPHGPRRERALRSMQHWHAASDAAGFWMAPSGSLHLAYLEEGWRVLQEYAAAAPDEDDITLLTARQATERFPAVEPSGLKGALFSASEATVQPPEAINQLVRWLGAEGVAFRFGRPVVGVDDHTAVLSDGTAVPFDRLVVCCGTVGNLLYVDALEAAGGRPCQIQMMCAVPERDGVDIGPILAADLTLRHYACFQDCPSRGALAERIETEMPFHEDWGIHVLVAQHADGSIALGDSHEYGPAPTIGSRMPVDKAVLDYLDGMTALGPLAIERHWTGSYLKAPDGQSYIHLQPEPDVDVVTGLGGAGMTLSFGLAEDVIAQW